MKIVIAISIVITCVFYRSYLEKIFYRVILSDDDENSDILTSKQLSYYDGVYRDKIYLSLLGSIFDVTTGAKHYGRDGPYNYFAAKDGSRAFITGDFKDESANKDHVLDLSCDDLIMLISWMATLTGKYRPVGVLEGRYYDAYGNKTDYMNEFINKYVQCEYDKEAAKLKNQAMPSCNMEWNEDKGSRVWCTDASGGVKRSWVGVPRQLYTPGQEHPRCVCVQPNEKPTEGFLKEYEDCPVTSSECKIKSN